MFPSHLPSIRPPPQHTREPPAFPNTSNRQRSSNVTVENPDLEFNKTALSACRSTIAQLEAELKRLKEAMAIKDKRILQLESVVGEASDFIAGREIPNETTEKGLQLVINRLDQIETKIAYIQPAQAPNSIVINSCSLDHTMLKQKQTSMTQTDPTCAESDELRVDDDHPQPRDDDDHGDSPEGSTPSL